MTDNIDPYFDIRPYNDDEIPAALERLIQDDEFISAILQHRYSNSAAWFRKLVSPFLKFYLRNKWRNLNSVEAIQSVVKTYLEKTLATTTEGVTYSGLEKLNKTRAYLFVCNHRDIAMDPALVNYGLFTHGHKTVRIAIGDNLLKKACSTELMRLNKSFIVKRSVKAPREMMKVLGQLSSYIKHSLDTGNSIWIAQKEGRAKDGNDFTDPAILKMFYVEGRKQKLSFSDYIKSLNIVPVSIAYENDPVISPRRKSCSKKQPTAVTKRVSLKISKASFKASSATKGVFTWHLVTSSKAISRRQRRWPKRLTARSTRITTSTQSISWRQVVTTNLSRLPCERR